MTDDDPIRLVGTGFARAVGVIETRRYMLKLYDPTDPRSARPKRTLGPVHYQNLVRGRATQAQQRAEAHARLRAEEEQRWREATDALEHKIVRDRHAAAAAARQLLAQPDWRVLDTEPPGRTGPRSVRSRSSTRPARCASTP